MEELQKTISQNGTRNDGVAFNFFNYNVESFGASEVSVFLINQTSDILDANDDYSSVPAGGSNAIVLAANLTGQEYVTLDDNDANLFTSTNPEAQNLGLILEFDYDGAATARGVTGIDDQEVIVADFMSFGFEDDGVQSGERFANQIIRIEAEETGDNTSTFEGSLEYTMVNQINIQEVSTFEISPIADDPGFIVIEDLTDEDAPRVSYNDLGADGVVTPVSDQEEAPNHSGVVSLNQDSYKIADTVVITLEDADLNVDSDLIDIFTVVVAGSGATEDQVSSTTSQSLSFGELGRLLDVTFDDIQWETPDANSCTVDGQTDATNSLEDVTTNTGLGATGFTLVETGTETGVFTGDFQIPAFWCRNADTSAVGSEQSYETTTGLDIEVNYVDFRDASGEIVEVGDSAGVRANTGSVSLDRTVYPVPFGGTGDFTGTNTESLDGRSIFPFHSSGLTDDDTTLDNGEFLLGGDLSVHIRVNDPDFDVNPSGEDTIAQNTTVINVGPVKISVLRGASEVVLGYAGGPAELDGPIDVADNNANAARHLVQSQKSHLMRESLRLIYQFDTLMVQPAHHVQHQ